MRMFIFFIALLHLVDAKSCHYNSYAWHVASGKSVNHKKVVQDYEGLLPYQKDPLTGCSVCEEDQVWIELPDIKPFKVCKKIAFKIETALYEAIRKGQKIKSVTGYRVGLTRGKIKEGKRTQFSNHSFGIAIDINSEHNGLYDHCIRFSTQCRLIKGGTWDPTHPKSLTTDSPIVRHLKKQGFLWGGEIKGKQKDFMHFSPTGY